MKKIKLPTFNFKKKTSESPESTGETRARNYPIFNLNKFLAALSYFYILVFIPLIFSKKNSLIKYHSRQGAALLIVWAIGFFSFYIPILPWLFALFILAEMIYGIVNACLGREKPLFWIGKLAEQK